MVLFFTHILFVVNHTFNATPPERLQHRSEFGAGFSVLVWYLSERLVYLSIFSDSVPS